MKRAFGRLLLREITLRITLAGNLALLLAAPVYLSGQTDGAKARPATLDEAVKLASDAREKGVDLDDIRPMIEGKMPEVNRGNIDALLVSTIKISDSKVRAMMVAELVEALCATDPAAGCDAGLRHLRKLSQDYASRPEVDQALTSQIEQGLEAWTEEDPAAALVWAKKAGEEKFEGFLSSVPEGFPVVVIATMLKSSREAGTNELHKLAPAQAASALSRFAWNAKSPGEAKLMLSEVVALPAAERTAPLSSYATALYEAGKADEVVRLLKEVAPDDACRAVMVRRAVTWGANQSDPDKAAARLKWLREHSPKDHLATNIGHFYGAVAFFNFDEAVVKMRKELKGLNVDDGLVAFFTANSAGMRNGKEAFSLACEIKNEAARDKALESLFGSWGFFEPAEALAALEAEKGISEKTKAKLRGQIRK